MRWHKTSEELPNVGDECLCKIIEDPDPEFPSIINIVLTYKEYSCDEYPWYDKINDTNYKQEYVDFWLSIRDISCSGLSKQDGESSFLDELEF